jgi:hypothetical protein
LFGDDLEFAFLCADFRRRTFYFYSEAFMKEIIFEKDYTESMIQDEDIMEFLSLLSSAPSQEQRNGDQSGSINRAFTKILFGAEELHGQVRLETDGKTISMIITK